MPPAKNSKAGLTDTWGRRNRKLPDYACQECNRSFHPKHATSRYCSRPCMWANNGGRNRVDAPIWWTDAKGYIAGQVWINGRRRHVKQHRWLFEQHLGRSLQPAEDVHHINGDKADNRIENLRLMTKANHTRHHSEGRTFKRGYKLNLSDRERAARSQRMREMRARQHH